MSDVPFRLPDNDNSTVALSFEDSAGNVVPNAIDAGSLTATSSDPASIAVTPSADQNSVLAEANGPLDTAVVVTVACTVNGVPFSGTETFDVGASAPTQLVLTPSAPVANTTGPSQVAGPVASDFPVNIPRGPVDTETNPLDIPLQEVPTTFPVPEPDQKVAVFPVNTEGQPEDIPRGPVETTRPAGVVSPANEVVEYEREEQVKNRPTQLLP